MKASWSSFDPSAFSFHHDPVLVIDNFWTASERKAFRSSMHQALWQSLQEMPHVHAAFPNCGNWRKARMESSDATRLLDKLAFPCIQNYMESFSDMTGRRMSFSYYSYGAGDCLLTHDDTAQEGRIAPGDSHRSVLRRLALIWYMHDEWQADWGGELMIYSAEAQAGSDRPRLFISNCVAPEPGSLVLFTVAHFHLVCRVDPVIGEDKRLSIAGWFLTEHGVPQYTNRSVRGNASHGAGARS